MSSSPDTSPGSQVHSIPVGRFSSINIDQGDPILPQAFEEVDLNFRRKGMV